MQRIFSIQNKVLLIGLVPLLVISLIFLFALTRLEAFSLERMLADKHAAYSQIWESLVNDHGQLLEFSEAMVRQNKELIRSLKTGDSALIAANSDNVWNQLSEKIDVLFFYNKSPPEKKVLYWLTKDKSGPIKSNFSSPILDLVSKSRQSAFGVARFPDGELRLMAATPYFNAPQKTYNLSVQGIALPTLTENFIKIIRADNIHIITIPRGDKNKIYLNKVQQQAIFRIDLISRQGEPLGFLAIAEDVSPILKAFNWTRLTLVIVPGVLIFFSLISMLYFVNWLVRRLRHMQEVLLFSSSEELEIEPVLNPDELDIIASGIIKQGQKLRQTHEGLIAAHQQQERETASRMTINKLLETSLADMSTVRQMEALLDIIFSVPWFSLHPKGAIFLVEPESGDLILQAHLGFRDDLLGACSRIPPGHCLCGQVVVSGKTVFASNIDENHTTRLPDMTDHGHYCVPIKGSDKKIIGVINLYVNANHIRQREEDEFLDSVAVTMAELIERKQLEERVKQQAEFDELTDLPNRSLFQDRLSHAIGTARRTTTEVVLMFIDLDRFKQVNDTLGHKAGDKLLQEAAKRISTCVRGSDTVSRLGGDEFTIILPKITHLFYVEFVARRILEELSEPFNLDAGTADISGSIGIALFPNDATDMDQLMINADTAMYYAKDAGRSTFRFFEEEMNKRAMKRLDMERSLKKALLNDEFVVYYQPKINPVTEKIVGMEALVRWQPPGLDLVGPGEFIDIAEQTGLIIPLGEVVLEKACKQNKQWIDKGHPPIPISVNLSPRQLQAGDDLLTTIERVLSETGLSPEFLELEVTESMMMENESEAISVMHRIKALGVGMSVDDFGTGYSSLSSLKNLPIHTLKIDRSFITDLESNADSAAIVGAIISLAKQLNLRVVAEGVERAEEVAFLKNIGCDEIQGFYYSKPVTPDKIIF